MSLQNRKDKAPKTTKIVPKYALRGYLLMVLLGLNACSDSVTSQMDDYAKRLERLSGEQRPAVTLLTSPEQPRVNQLRIHLPELSISFADSFRLNHCRLSQLIAERNSSLGKVMSPANQLYYEIDVTHALKECLAAPVKLSNTLRTDLEQALIQKEASLPFAVHNFLTTDEIWRSNFRFGRNNLPLSEADGYTHSLAALSYFAHTLKLLMADPHHQDLDLSQWHKHVETLGQARFLSEYWRTLANVPITLASLTQLLAVTTKNIPCSNLARPQEADYLYNVMLNVYIAKLQPAFARWVHYGQQLEPVIDELVSFTQGEAWTNYVQQLNDGKTDALERHTREHAEQWQALLKKCRLSPTGYSGNN